MDESQRQIYEFGTFRLDARRRSLDRLDGEVVPLKPKSCEILLVLLEHYPETVSKEELKRLVWPDSFVDEGNLTVNMSLLRKALGDTGRQHQFILTEPGKGYRFIADLSRHFVEENPLSDFFESEKPETKKPEISAGFRQKNLLLSGLLAIFLLAVFIIFWFFVRRIEKNMPFAGFRLTKLTTSGKVKNAAISPDGRYAAYTVTEDRKQSVWLKQLSAGSDVQIAPPAESYFSGISFSHDGELIYLLLSEKAGLSSIYQMSKLGGPLKRLAEDVDSPPELSPDGKNLVFLRGLPDQKETALFILQADGGEPQKLAARSAAEGFIISARPAWSPDGKKIVCAVKKQDDKGKFAALVSVDAVGGKIEELSVPRFNQISQIAWVPQTENLIVAAAGEDSPSSNQIWNVSLSDGQTKRITNDLNNYNEVSLTADGKTIMTVNTDLQTNIWLVPGFDTDRARKITSTNYDGARGLTFMPDGSLIYTSKNGENLNLWRIYPDGTTGQITSNTGNNFQPSVSPDSRKIAFVSDRSGVQHIWIADTDGNNVHQLTNGVDDNAPAWMPDGQTIIYRSYTQGNPLLFSIAAGGGTPVRLTDKISGNAQISPDGQKILYSLRSETLSAPKLTIIPAGGSQIERTFNLTSSLYRWTRDGQAVLFANPLTDNNLNLWRQPLDPNLRPTALTNWKDERIYWFDISPDGQTAACARGVSLSDAVLISDVPVQK